MSFTNCIYRNSEGKCEKFSTETSVSYCVDGHCAEKILNNFGEIKSLNKELLAEFLVKINADLTLAERKISPYEFEKYEHILNWLGQSSDKKFQSNSHSKFNQVIFFNTEKELLSLTGVENRNQLWDAGFDLDDWNFGFVTDTEWTEDWINGDENKPYYQYWLLLRMEDYSAGYEHIEFNGKHYYISYH